MNRFVTPWGRAIGIKDATHPRPWPIPCNRMEAWNADERHAQREALERLQSEMREHVADAAALADRIAALQLRIDIALAELTKPSNSTTAE